MSKIYDDASAITGPLSLNKKVSFRSVVSKDQKLTLFLFLLVIVGTSASLIWFILNTFSFSHFNLALIIAVGLIGLVELIRFLQSITLLIFAYFAKDPIPMVPQTGQRIAVMTTIVPNKEPFEIVARTLMAMTRIDPGEGNVLDVWLLDEGNDYPISVWCRAMGIKHFSRKGVEKWNQPSGPFKAKTKHGNHNAWRDAHEKEYDIVAQMDPDHIPKADFLTRTLGYFKDPEVGFVVAPQVYGNINENFIAGGSAFQAYLFHGIIQRGGNGLGAPLLIGTNHLYRTEAFKSIGGYQDSIIEDHLTSMVIYGSEDQKNASWKGVYTPDIIAVGEGPTSFTDYFNQQKRWAYGIWDILITSTPKALRRMNKRQALTFTMLQFFYPSVAISWVMSTFATILFSGLIVEDQTIGIFTAVFWLMSMASTMGLFFWLRRFNLVENERKEWGIKGMGLLLMCMPVYVSAAWQAIRRKPLSYAVTAKGDMASPDTLSTFTPHLYWIVINLTAVLMTVNYSAVIASSSLFWMFEHIAICLLPISIFAYIKFRPTLQRYARLIGSTLDQSPIGEYEV